MKVAKLGSLLVLMVLVIQSTSLQRTLQAQQQPVLQVSPASLSFEGEAGGSPPAPHLLTIANAGGGLLQWQASADAKWIVLGASEGTLSGGRAISLAVLVETEGLTAGAYQGTITIADPQAEGSPAVVDVTLTLTGRPPVLEVSPTSLSFQAQEGGSNPTSKTLTIKNSGGPELTWSAQENIPWLSLNRLGGALQPRQSVDVQVFVNLTGLQAGTRQGEITITAPGAQNSPVVVPVTLIIEPRPSTVTVCPSGCPFSEIQAAIDAAGSGATITIDPGTYFENLVIRKSLRITGVGKDQVILKPKESTPVISIINGQTIEVTIESIAIEGLGGKDFDPDADGVNVSGRAKATLQNSSIIGNQGHAIRVMDFAQIIIRSNEISGNGWGIVVTDSAQAAIQDNTISGRAETINIEFWDSSSGSIQNNTISGGQWGVMVAESAAVSIINNTILDNICYGIALNSISVTTIRENLISGHGCAGINFFSEARAELVGNTIIDNAGWGVRIYLRPCGADTDEVFQGEVKGSGNEIPNKNEPNGNGQGDICPSELEFLKTEEGGRYP